MSYTTEYVDGGRGMLRVGKGVVAGDDLINGALEFQANQQRLATVRYALVDFTEVDEFNISAGDMKQVAQACLGSARLTPGGVVAIVAPRDDVFGMARMWEALMDGAGWETHVFRVRDEARTWLVDRVGPVEISED